MERPLAVTVKIRPAVRSDATAILLVRREAALAKAASHYAPEILNDWAHAVDAARIARQISDPDYRVLVAEAGGEIIGFAMAVLSNRELKALYTRPNPIGGIGRALLLEIENLAFQTVPHLVCEASLNAEGFYKANGYAEEDRQDRVSRRGVTSRVVWMKKSGRMAMPDRIPGSGSSGLAKRTRHQHFVKIFFADLQGPALDPVGFEPGGAVKASAGDV